MRQLFDCSQTKKIMLNEEVIFAVTDANLNEKFRTSTGLNDNSKFAKIISSFNYISAVQTYVVHFNIHYFT